MSTPLERLKRMNEENARPVTVSVGLIRSAISEIEMHTKAHGKNIFTDMILIRLRKAIGDEGEAA